MPNSSCHASLSQRRLHNGAQFVTTVAATSTEKVMRDEEEIYPSGPNLSGHFPPMPEYTVPLPFDFDTACRCGKELERLYALYRTRRRPFAVFGCQSCGHHLHLFEAPRIPLILALEDFPRSTSEPGQARVSLESACFSEYVDFLIEKREEKWKRNLSRAQGSGGMVDNT